MKAHRLDHVGIVVQDLAAVKSFFLDLGLEVRGEWEVEGEVSVDQVIGLDNVKTAAAMLGVPGGQATVELIQFFTPADEAGSRQLPANTLGLRHIAFVVEDIEALVTRLKANGTETFSEIQNFGGYKLCYVRGPEGIIVELGETA